MQCKAKFSPTRATNPNHFACIFVAASFFVLLVAHAAFFTAFNARATGADRMNAISLRNP
jgi:hypothetical protein|tara:strand:- start:218 stop:397 length:180 start_codon:yes stop_codon:yes gene_type:complete